MPARLTNGAKWCKTRLAVAASIVLAMQISANASPNERSSRLRDCVSTAASAEAVLQCEVQHQRWLRRRIDELGDALRQQLPADRHPALQENIRAWRTYYEREVALLDLTLARRGDGLAPRLRPGVISRLLEQREQQLREHLHNLKF